MHCGALGHVTASKITPAIVRDIFSNERTSIGQATHRYDHKLNSQARKTYYNITYLGPLFWQAPYHLCNTWLNILHSFCVFSLFLQLNTAGAVVLHL